MMKQFSICYHNHKTNATHYCTLQGKSKQDVANKIIKDRQGYSISDCKTALYIHAPNYGVYGIHKPY